jgi:fumarate hydratase class II
MKTRIEEDALGTVPVPESAYYGAQTQRAIENFPVSGLTFSRSFIRALGLIKKCAAGVNQELGLLDPELAKAIIAAAQEVVEGQLDSNFIVDVFQTGSGTSTNMNANEVIAGRANEILTNRRGGRLPVHPNDHVNLGQSSNDVIPSTIHIAAMTAIKYQLIPSLNRLHQCLTQKAHEFKDIIKIGRTHLQDAVPISLGQEFGGYGRQIELGIRRMEEASEGLSEIALGGTAVGTGLNTHPDFPARVIERLSHETGCTIREAENHFEAQAAQDTAVKTSGLLKTLAVSLAKIANDIRWLASGPRCGLGEINLPSLQPGSSIMPGKVNPVIPEVVVQVAAQVVGNDATITLGGLGGNFELNTMLPVIGYNLLQSISLLNSTIDLFATKCIDGISANRDKCAASVEQSLALSTYLVPTIGYDKAASVSKEAYRSGKTVRQVVVESGLMTEAGFDELFEEIRVSK